MSHMMISVAWLRSSRTAAFSSSSIPTSHFFSPSLHTGTHTFLSTRVAARVYEVQRRDMNRNAVYSMTRPRKHQLLRQASTTWHERSLSSITAFLDQDWVVVTWPTLSISTVSVCRVMTNARVLKCHHRWRQCCVMKDASSVRLYISVSLHLSLPFIELILRERTKQMIEWDLSALLKYNSVRTQCELSGALLVWLRMFVCFPPAMRQHCVNNVNLSRSI